MTVQVIAAGAHRRMPWKNGGGETLEVAAHPPGADLADFVWRVSMAVVAADGPFSGFPSVDRTITILDGDGLMLGVAGRNVQTLTCGSPPWSFPGDSPATASLLGGPIRDLNVMTRRGVAAHKVEPIALTGPSRIEARRGWTFALCGSGRIEIGAETVLSRYDVAAFEAGDILALRPLDGSATAFVIRITLLG